MNPIEWLEQNAPGFSVLTEQEREAITHFALLWSFFEARVLNKSANSHAILALTHKWSSQACLDASIFEDSLQYFQQRYFSGYTESQHFRSLKLRNNDCPELVKAVLKSDNQNPADRVAVLLIIVFRLRNNLFHGNKWADGIRGQLGNFTHANSTLMKALSVAGL